MNSLIIATSLVSINALTPAPTPSPINGVFSRCISTDTPLDIVFMVDSSGSVFDDEFNNWQYQLDLVSDIVDNAIPSNSRVALINYSGCGSSFSYVQCQQQGRLKRMIRLSTYGSPNDLDAVLSTIDTIDGDDFLGGYTWTNEALQLALDEFNSNPTVEDTNKMIVLITAGAPYPADGGHEPCMTSTGYVSPTLQSLRDLDVAIITVGIDIDEDTKQEYFDCSNGEESYFEGTFASSSLSPTAAAIGVPTRLPTPSPVSGGSTQSQSLSDGDASSSYTADEDLSDSIGDFICSELGSSRMVVPGTAKPSATPTPTLADLQGLCESTTELDVVFMVDSSGSVYDEQYNNWQSQLDLVYDIIDSLPDATTRASLINFSGCGSSFTLAQCIEQGRLDTVFDLDTYGNDMEMTLTRIKQMDSDDFNGGFTWTNEALGLALDQFNSYSIADKTKIIVLLTDGEPYPYDERHEPCLASTSYESDTLIALNELGVDIITVGIDISVHSKEEYLDCLSDSYFVSQFSTLNSLSIEIGELICDNINGEFSTLTLAPTMKPVGEPTARPTLKPVTAPSSIKPTPSPTNTDEATRGPITSNGIMVNIYINIAIISGFIAFALF